MKRKDRDTELNDDIPGTWFLSFVDGSSEIIEIKIINDRTEPSQHEFRGTFSLIYRDGSMRIFPWSAIREAHWIPK